MDLLKFNNVRCTCKKAFNLPCQEVQLADIQFLVVVTVCHSGLSSDCWYQCLQFATVSDDMQTLRSRWKHRKSIFVKTYLTQMFDKQWEERQSLHLYSLVLFVGLVFFKIRGSYWYSYYLSNKTKISFFGQGWGKHEPHPYILIQGQWPTLVTV